MNVLIDADACPVTDIAVALCRTHKVRCILLCDTAHEMHRTDAEIIVLDQGSDSVDFTLVNMASSGDIVITQDYGLASMCLSKHAVVIHQDGWLYNEDNIQALLFQRHAAREYRAAGGRTKGPRKRKSAQDAAFAAAFEKLLQQAVHG